MLGRGGMGGLARVRGHGRLVTGDYPPLLALAKSPSFVGMAGGRPVFDARNTQLQTSAPWGNPSMDLGDGIFQALETLGDVGFRNKKFSQADARNILRIMPFQNLNGIAQLTSGMISPLPEWSPAPRH